MKYLVLYRADQTATQVMQHATPEEVKASMERWIAWKQEATIKGCEVEFRMPLQGRAHITAETATESSSDISGHSIITADSKEILIEVLKTHPQLQRVGTSIELLEILSIPGIEA